MEKYVEIGRLLDLYGKFLTDRQRSVTEQTVYEDCSLAEIAERESISRQAVRDALVRAEAQLYEMEDRLGLMKIMSGLEELRGMSGANTEISAKIDSILAIIGGNDGV